MDRDRVIKDLGNLKELLKWKKDTAGYGHYIETIDDAVTLIRNSDPHSQWVEGSVIEDA